MSARVENQNARSSPSDIIDTFNHFFMNVPTNKSFDMSYKVYIRDLADSGDRSVSARSSLINVGAQPPVTIASHGIVPTMSTSSTALSTMSSTQPSSTNLTLKSLASPKTESMTMTEIQRLCEDNMNRKARSMVDLSDFNDKYGNGFHPPPPSASTPPTVYENMSSISKKKKTKLPTVSPNPSTFTKDNFGRLANSEVKLSVSNAGDLFIRVADCFD